MKKQNAKWCHLTVHAIEKELHTDASCGLSCKEARLRYRSQGANTLFDPSPKTDGRVFAQLARDPAWLLLGLGCLVALCFRKIALTVSILVCMSVGILYALLCFKKEREYKSRLAAYRMPTVTVIRDGKRYTTSARGIVLGDLILLRSGDLVPCDCRLARSENLCVQTLCRENDGKLCYLPQEKCAKTLYGYEEDVSLMQAENMLCGGARITKGVAYAIAIAVGENTELGRDRNFEMPAEKKDGSAQRGSTRLIPYLRIYRFAIFAAFLPITVLGVLTSSADFGILSVFLSVCALTASASTAYLSLFFYETEMRAERDCAFSCSQWQDHAIFKSDRAAVQLSQITDLFVMGHCATSDGKTHLLRVWLGDGEVALEKDHTIPSISGLAEAFCLLDDNAARELTSENLTVWRDTFSLFLHEILHISGYDSEALRMRTLDTRLLPAKSAENQMLEVRMHDKTQRILFSNSLQWIRHCACYEKDGEIRPLDPARRQALIEEIERREEQNSALQIVLRKQNCDLCLVGVAALGERMQDELPTVLQGLASCGIRTSIFLKGTRKTEGMYAADLRLRAEDTYVEKMRSNQLCENDFIEKYRVLQGFTTREVAELIDKMKKNGRKIAVMSVERADEVLQQSADLFIACDGEIYHKYGPSDTIFEPLPREGSVHSSRASQSMRRACDLLVCRADHNNGGLFAILKARLACQSTAIRTESLLSFLLFSQIARLAALLLAVCTGFGLLDASHLLYCGLILETVAVFLLSSVSISGRVIQSVSKFSKRLPLTATLHCKKGYLVPVLSIACVMLLGFVLSLCGALDKAEAIPTVLFSLLITQSSRLLIQVFGLSDRVVPSSTWFVLLLALLPPILAAVLSFLFPPCNRLFHLGAIGPFSVGLIVLMPLLSLLFERVFSKK